MKKARTLLAAGAKNLLVQRPQQKLNVHKTFHSSSRSLQKKMNKEELKQFYQRSVDFENGGAQEFWDAQAQDITWFKKYDKILDTSASPFNKWFPGGLTNTCYNCIDVHVENGKANKVAVIYDSPLAGAKKTFTYGYLKQQIELVAGYLNANGVRKGDRVVIYMPMVVETLIGMLACQRIGAIHSVVFGGFAPHELAIRINDAQPKVILSANFGIEPGPRFIDYKKLLDEAIRQAGADGEHVKCLILNRPLPEIYSSTHKAPMTTLQKGRDDDWYDALASAKPFKDCVPVESNDESYILYTSGTTGKPKGVVRPTGGHMVALKWSMKNIYGMEKDSVWWAGSDFGWVVGHSYIAYAPLLYGITSVLFEGKPVGTPDSSAYWRVIQEYKVNGMFAAPTAIRAIKREDSQALLPKKYDLSSLKAFFVAGERCDKDTIVWLSNVFDNKIPVIDHWWQTETGSPICGRMLGYDANPLDIEFGSANYPICGWDVRVIPIEADKDGDASMVDRKKEGNIVIKLPLPPGAFTDIWRNSKRYVSSYMTKFPGFYDTTDAGHISDKGNVFVMARTDDIINVAAHRLSTSEMEEVLNQHQAVAESAVIGVKDDLKGEVPVGFIVLKVGVPADKIPQIEKECVDNIRANIGAIACFKICVSVARLPKTRSGKILRGTMRKIANGEEYTFPATIEDPVVLDEITAALKARGLPAAQ